MSENTKRKPKTNKGSKMNKVELKRSMQKSKVICDANCFI